MANGCNVYFSSIAPEAFVIKSFTVVIYSVATVLDKFCTSTLD